jgi:hypothetical protein
MAFAIRNLSVLAYANGFTLWHYNAGTADSGPAANEPGYYAEAGDMLTGGDMIMVSHPGGAAILSVATDGNSIRTAPLLTPQ